MLSVHMHRIIGTYHNPYLPLSQFLSSPTLCFLSAAPMYLLDNHHR